MTGAIGVERSGNAKTGAVSATYAAQSSCPTTCPLLGAGCYAESGRVGMVTGRLAAEATDASRDDVAQSEADAIDRMSGRRPLRLHVVGDCATDATARVVSDAADRYRARHGSPVWTYTHAWRDVARESWHGVSVRASVESIAEIRDARERGYPAAIVVDEHPADGRAYTVDGERVIPCAEQTRGRSCAECRLCWTSDATIAFAAHGPKASLVRESLGG